MRVKKFIGFFLMAVTALSSCNSPYTVGKKRGYFAIDFPDKQYQTFDQPGYPYTFESICKPKTSINTALI